jgi:hypothetical protein
LFLQQNSYLDQLEFRDLSVDRNVSQGLAATLRENEGLAYLRLRYCTLDDRCWSEVMEAVSTHPAQRKLTFSEIIFDSEGDPPSFSEKCDRTNAASNKQVDELGV